MTSATRPDSPAIADLSEGENESSIDVDEYLVDSKKSGVMSLSTNKRKRILFWHTPVEAQRWLEDWVETEMSKLPPIRDFEDCWLHPSPGLGQQWTIAKLISWTNSVGKREGVRVHLGVATLFLKNQADQSTLSDEQLDGLVDRSWHLSQ